MAARLFALVWGVGGAVDPYYPCGEGGGDAEAGGLPTCADGPLPPPWTSSQLRRAPAEPCGEVGAEGAVNGGAAPAPEARRLAYEMYVGFCAGRAEDEGVACGRGARLAAALSDSSSSSLWYTRQVVTLYIYIYKYNVDPSIILPCIYIVYHDVDARHQSFLVSCFCFLT